VGRVIAEEESRMKTLLAGALVMLLGGLFVLWAQPPGERDRPPARRDGPPPRFEPGMVLPPFVRDDLKLTKDQQKQLADLEKDVRERLLKILTPEQRRLLENHHPPGPGGPPRGKDRPDAPPPPKQDDGQVRDTSAPAGIQWFATWETGLKEAQRTGRPILLVSAAPHCSGVSGVW
jgi:hypothetical protein